MSSADRRRTALGRGLSALIPGAGEPASGGPIHPRVLPIEQLCPAHQQPRVHFDDSRIKGLADSIAANGVIQPIVVRRLSPEAYEIIAGERRWRAAQLAGLTDVPVVVRDATEAQAFELALIENVQRQDLNPLEEAAAFRHLVDTHGLTQEAIARRVGKDRVTVANALRLLKLPVPVRELLAAGLLTAGHARALMTAPAPSDQESLAHAAVRAGWSVRETERRARATRAVPNPPPQPDQPRPSAELGALEDRLRAALGAPVRLVNRHGKGRVEIRFNSAEELDRLVDLLRSLQGR